MNGAVASLWAWTSWISSANDPEHGFPLQSLPFCAFVDGQKDSRLGVRIGDFILDLAECETHGFFSSLPNDVRTACTAPVLNQLMACAAEGVHALRSRLISLLREDADQQVISQLHSLLQPVESAKFRVPVQIGDYTDFYASIHHATNVGRLFRPDQPLLPNYKFVPIGYHGRASSIVISDTHVRRPFGQILPPPATMPIFAASRQLDYEVEIGAYMATGNALGERINIADAEQHIFGFTLVNDWSARDIQAWEYQPLGPFLGKSFATTVAPWVVPSAALDPFRVPLSPRAEDHPEALPHLRSPWPQTAGIDMQIEAFLSTSLMRTLALAPVRLSCSNLRDLFWSFAQMVAHHTSNGCNLLPGDLLASGTVSGPGEQSLGCLLEITKRGSTPLTLPSGETRAFLEDGDEVVLKAMCRREGFSSVSLGECRGTIGAASS